MSRDINIVETKDAMAEPQLHEIGFKTDVPPKQEMREFPFWAAVAAEFWGMLLFIWITLTVRLLDAGVGAYKHAPSNQ